MQHLFQRLREIARLIDRDDLGLSDDEKLLPEALRNELQAHILAQEIALADCNAFADEVDDIQAAIDSFAGGPGNDSSSDSDDDGDNQ